MKRKRTRLRARIIHILRHGHETRHTSDRHNMAVVPLDHCWEEFLSEEEVGDGVHIEDAAEFGFGLPQDCTVEPDSGVVDQDCGFTVVFTDLGSYFFDSY
jgi:hypothetical protein